MPRAAAAVLAEIEALDPEVRTSEAATAALQTKMRGLVIEAHQAGAPTEHIAARRRSPKTGGPLDPQAIRNLIRRWERQQAAR